MTNFEKVNTEACSTIESRILDLQELVGNVGGNVDILSNRLNKVMVSQPATELDKPRDPEGMSPLSKELYSLVINLVTINTQIKEMLSALEL